MTQSNEASYPRTFREAEARALGEKLMRHDSVVIVGMKRVGISNFLRFFLSHPQVASKYLNQNNFLFVSVDLNDLVEREIYPFWVLYLKRLVDSITASNLPEASKKTAKKLFTESIQLKDIFFTVDCIRQILKLIVDEGFTPVVFLLRFDRLKDAVTLEFFSNLQSLKEASRQKLSFVFTSFRALYYLAPNVFTKQNLAVFAQNQFIPPASDTDMEIILNSLVQRYELKLKPETIKTALKLAGGHVHYLQLMLLRFQKNNALFEEQPNILEYLAKDEEINLQSEELYANLTKLEQEVLLKIVKKEAIPQEIRSQAQYLWNTGMIDGEEQVFSPLFEIYLKNLSSHQNGTTEFTKKEHKLFSFLKDHEGNLCEREDLINAVWPEQAEAGVSDWAVDRLVARVRSKLKKQNSQYEIVTVITRGYKLVKRQ